MAPGEPLVGNRHRTIEESFCVDEVTDRARCQSAPSEHPCQRRMLRAQAAFGLLDQLAKYRARLENTPCQKEKLAVKLDVWQDVGMFRRGAAVERERLGESLARQRVSAF